MAPNTSTVLLKDASFFTVKVSSKTVVSSTSKVEPRLVAPDTYKALLKDASFFTVKVSSRVATPSTFNADFTLDSP